MHSRTSPAPIVAVRRLCLATLALLAVSATRVPPLRAQTVTRIGNDFIAAHVVTSPSWGRFWLTAGSRYADSLRYLYNSGAGFITSNVIFRVSRGGVEHYYGNIPMSFEFRPNDPMTSQPIAFVPFDSLHATNDTLAMGWTNLDGFRVTMRFVPERASDSYSDGGDMLIEFEAHPLSASEKGSVGVMVMLDLVNSDSKVGSQAGDKSSLLASDAYRRSGGRGMVRIAPGDTIPDFYHVGNFGVVEPLNTLFPIHRLRGRSRRGAPLTPPSAFAVGDWNQLRWVAWDVPSTTDTAAFSDIAAIVRWDTIPAAGGVRTAFGQNDRSGNDMFTCRDSTLFVDIRTTRVVYVLDSNAGIQPDSFDVDMLVTNTDVTDSTGATIRLHVLHGVPSQTAGRIRTDSSFGAEHTVDLAPGASQWLRWRLTVDTIPADTLVPLNFEVHYSGWTKPQFAPFLERCAPVVSIVDEPTHSPPERDTLAPIVAIDVASQTPRSWTVTATDRHHGYAHDTGVDSLAVIDGYNVDIELQPFDRCDTASSAVMNVRVVDVEGLALAVIRATDCRGNEHFDTLSYGGLGASVSDESITPGGDSAMRIIAVRPQPLLSSDGRRDITVSVAAPAGQGGHLRLYDVDGRVMQRFELPRAASGASHDVVLHVRDDLPSGAYLLGVAGGRSAVGVVVLDR